MQATVIGSAFATRQVTTTSGNGSASPAASAPATGQNSAKAANSAAPAKYPPETLFSFKFMWDLLEFQKPTFYVGLTPTEIGPDGMPQLAKQAPPMRKFGGGADAPEVPPPAPAGSAPDMLDGIDLSQVNAADAAKALMDAYGSNGQLSLDDIEKGLSVPATSPLGKSVADEFKVMTHGRGGAMSLSELTNAIQTFVNIQRTNDEHSWGYVNGQFGQLSDDDVTRMTGKDAGGASSAAPQGEASQALFRALDQAKVKQEADAARRQKGESADEIIEAALKATKAQVKPTSVIV